MAAGRLLRRGAALLAATTTLSTTALAVPAPASAAEGCLRDVSVLLVLAPEGCDDTTPPETSIGATAPRVSPGGWVTKRTLRVGFLGVHTDADTDPVSFQCHLSVDAEAPAAEEWDECDDTEIFTGLAESTATPYVLRVRAVDSVDAATAWSDGNPVNGLTDEPVDDVDQTPATLTFRVDATAPDTRVSGTPHDPLTPELPMVTTTSPRFHLSAAEAAAFRCTLNGRAVPCAAGPTTLRALSPGDKTLQVQAVDAAGNVDPSPAVTRFAVPADLRPKGRTTGWTRVRSSSHLGGDVLQARERGAELTFVAKRFRELRLIASTGPKAGTIALRIGGTWHTVSLKRSVSTRADQVQVRDELAPLRSGRIRVRVVSHGKPVALDGVLAH